MNWKLYEDDRPGHLEGGIFARPQINNRGFIEWEYDFGVCLSEKDDRNQLISYKNDWKDPFVPLLWVPFQLPHIKIDTTISVDDKSTKRLQVVTYNSQEK